MWITTQQNSSKMLHCNKVNSYIAQYPILRIAQSALLFTPWQTSYIKHYLSFPGKHSAMQQLVHKEYLYTNIHHCL